MSKEHWNFKKWYHLLSLIIYYIQQCVCYSHPSNSSLLQWLHLWTIRSVLKSVSFFFFFRFFFFYLFFFFYFFFMLYMIFVFFCLTSLSMIISTRTYSCVLHRKVYSIICTNLYGKKEWIDIFIHMTDSLFCIPEISTT